MKQRQIAPLLAVIISFELIVTPVIAIADDNATKPKDTGASTAEIFSSVLTIGQTILSQVNQQQMSPHMHQDMAAFAAQQTPQPDKYFNPQKLSKIPGLGQYMAMNNINPQLLDCKTLPTTIHEAKNEVCRLGVTTDKNIPPSVQLNEMFTYYNQYTQVNKMYRNFTAESNVDGQLFGVGCMKNAMQVLNGFFQYRMNELDKLTTNLEAINNQFREASRTDLNAIEESTAVLDGGNSDLTNKIKTTRPDLFDFSKRFDNPACSSMMTAEKFNDIGKGKGLNEISKNLKKTLTTPSGKFSGESYSTSHAKVVEDINKLADKVGKQMELNFSELSESNGKYSSIIGGMRGLSSSHGLNNILTPDLFSDVQTKFSEKNDKMRSEMADVASELGDLAGPALQMMRNPNSGAFDSEVATVETRIKNRCLNNSVNLNVILDKIYDPSASKFANDNASNFLKDKLKQIMDNDRTSLDKKLAELKSLESQEGSRYYLKMENSYEVQDVDASGKLTTRVVGASAVRTPSVYLSDVIRNCEAQFKVNHLNNKMSGAAAVQKLKKLHQDYKALAKSHAQEAKDEIKNKLINCNNSLDANAQVVGSCGTPDVFNTGAPGFCANAALSCSKNMQTCSKQAEKFVAEIKQERAARVNNYKGLVQKNKQDIVKIFDTALATYMRDGELLRGAFGVGFSSPKDIQREVPEGQRYLDTFRDATSGSPDGTLMLEDPDKYVAMFKQNIDKLKESVKQQQDQIMGSGSGRNSGGLLAEHIRNTEKNYKDVVRESQTYADACIRLHDDFVRAAETQKNQQRAEDMKQNSELGEKLPLFCKKYATARTNPVGACSGNVSDLVGSAMKAANRAGNQKDVNSISDFSDICDGYNNESSYDEPDVKTMCEKLTDFPYCNPATIPPEEKVYCKKTAPTIVNNTTIPGEPDCSEFALSQIKKAFRRSHARTVTSAAPSFCTAGNDSDVNSPKGQLLQMFKGFNQGMAGAIGQ